MHEEIQSMSHSCGTIEYELVRYAAQNVKMKCQDRAIRWINMSVSSPQSTTVLFILDHRKTGFSLVSRNPSIVFWKVRVQSVLSHNFFCPQRIFYDELIQGYSVQKST